MWESAVAREAGFWLMTPQVDGGGKTVQSTIETADGSNAQAYNENDAEHAAGTSADLDLNHNWAQYRDTYKLTGLASAILESGDERHAIPLIAREVQNKMDGMARTMNLDLITGTGINAAGKRTIIGLAHIIDAANVWGGQNRSLEPAVRPFVSTSGSLRSITGALLDLAHDTLIDDYKGYYDAIYTSRALARKIAAITGEPGFPDANNRHIMADNTARRIVLANGFEGLNPLQPVTFFNERPVYAIPRYAAARVDFIDRSKFRMRPLTRIFRTPVQVRGDNVYFQIIYRGQSEHTNPRMGSASIQMVN